MDIWNTVEILAQIINTNAWDREEFKQQQLVT
jgi:hypothetical protein